jgi:hypothetical protein
MQLSVEGARRAVTAGQIAAFLLLLSLPILDTVFQLDGTKPADENRTLARFPNLTFEQEAMQKVFGELEAYYNDHFGFRNKLIRTNKTWKKKWFGEAPASSLPALEGLDGWYYYAGGQMGDHFSGAVLFTEAELESWRQLLEARYEWLKERGIAYVFAVAPNKESIYPEYLPPWLRERGGRTKTDQFFSYMRAHSKVPVVDLRAPMLDAKNGEPLFQSSDTHWNDLGALVAYQAVLQALNQQVPEINPLTRDEFTWRWVPEAKGGDLALILGQKDQIKERNLVYAEAKAPRGRAQTMPLPTERLKREWKPKTEPTVTYNPQASGKVVLFHDSFALGWLKFLGQDFHEVIYLWQYHLDKEFLEREKPDLVIDEILERFLYISDPRELAEKEKVMHDLEASQSSPASN